MKKIGLVDFGSVGNIYSIKNAVLNSGNQCIVIDSAKKLNSVSRVILPGVGSFHEAMTELKDSGFAEQLNAFDGPILGICLGMQMLSKIGFEGGKTNGLNLIDAEVKKIHCNSPIPHMGFNKINVINKSGLLNDIEQEEFYFMHSYELINFTNITSLSEYGDHTFVSSVEKDNIYGVQFHPEKSRYAGIKLFENFSIL